MRFTFAGKTFRIEFERKRKTVHVRNPFEDGEINAIMSSFPYTTVRILEEMNDGLQASLYRTATVGCSLHDRFSFEDGRIAALRAITTTIPKPMRKALWDGYIKRVKGSPSKDDIIAELRAQVAALQGEGASSGV